MTHQPLLNEDATLKVAVASGEECVRCKEVDHDRRTLWTACMYDLSETGIPFEGVNIVGTLALQTGSRDTKFGPLPVFGEPNEKAREYFFHTLRFCKRCRGDYISALKTWFFETPSAEGDGDIPMKINGDVKMLTEEQALAYKATKGE